MDQLSLDLFAFPPRQPGSGGSPDPGRGSGDPEPPLVLQSLEAALVAGYPRRTLLVGRTRGEGRDLLRCLSLRGTAWLGVEPTTLRPLAVEIVGAELAESGLRVLDDTEQEALVEEALDRALEALPWSPWMALAEGVGFREAVTSTLASLRLAGIRSRRVARSDIRDPHRRELLSLLLAGYEEALRAGRVVDTAGVLLRAALSLEKGSQSPAARILILPGVGVHGLAGRLARILVRCGGQVLEADPVPGWNADGAVPRGILWSTNQGDVAAPLPDDPLHPSVRASLFRAGGVSEELREVIRQILAARVSFDRVEIVASDPVVYGSALHSIAAPLGIPVSYGVGLPVERTRVGRVATAWFRWVEGGFPTDVLQGLLDAGDLWPPAGESLPEGARLARRLRMLRIGWGWDRYLAVLDGARRGVDGSPLLRQGESEEEGWSRHLRVREELEGLRTFLTPVLDAIPGPLRGGAGGTEREPASPADLAAALKAFLAWIRPGEGVERTATERLHARLDRVVAALRRPTDSTSALRILRRHLRFRVPAPDARGPAPWLASGGYLHLTDLEHGGRTGRPLTFLVGMDADHFAIRSHADPLLPDPDRRRLSPELPTGSERVREGAFLLAALLARLRGKVILSFPAWSSAEGREVAPAPVLLRIARQLSGNAGIGYQDLPRLMGPVVGRVPSPGAVPLDRDDAWLGGLSSRPGILRDGREAARRGIPGLAAGVAARTAWESAPGPHSGKVSPLPELDPRINPERVVSASTLEHLGTCPLRYLYRTVLGVQPSTDPPLDPDRWLDPLHRGSLLHRVFERILRETGPIDPDVPGMVSRATALGILEVEADREARELPSPGPVIREREMERLRRDVEAFVALVNREGAPWEALELRFGPEAGAAVTIQVEGGVVGLRGAVDRLDRGALGLEVIDYKTGSARRFSEGTGVYHGGRRLQHLLYLLAVEALTGEPVSAVTYLFPGSSGRNERRSYGRAQLQGGGSLVGRLLDLVREGQFLPTEEAEDCRFCDYRSVCRVTGEGDRLQSPPARWSLGRIGDDPVMSGLRTVRSWEERLPVDEPQAGGGSE